MTPMRACVAFVITLADDLSFSVKAEELSMPATAAAPGCITTRVVTGQTWSTDSSTFVLNGTPKATIERSSCVNNRDELKVGPTTDMDMPIGEARRSTRSSRSR